LNPGSFKADAATIRKACGNEPDYNPDNDFNTQNYNSCVSKTNAAEFQSVDPDFNLELEAF
jgi:hypothetical protein